MGTRARAFINIQDGCDRHCAYCIVPSARGTGKSVLPEDVIKKCLDLARFHCEIVLAGIDIGQYRDAQSGMGLVELLEKLVSVEGMPRLRISSIDPTLINDRLIALFSSGKICRHIHLSLQSASDGVIKAMGRAYGSREIIRAVNDLTDRVPGIAVTGDIIAGFPGEIDEEHRETVEILSSLPLAGLHVFPYSQRDGTRAVGLPGQVPQKTKKERSAELRLIAEKARRRFLNGLVGRKLDVIVTSRHSSPSGTVSAFSDNAVPVELTGNVVAYGQLGTAVVKEVLNLKTFGEWL